MIILILFGLLSGEIKISAINSKYMNKSLNGNKFRPHLIFDLSRALYDLGADLKGGALKDLDMKYYFALTKLIDDRLLVIGIEKNKKNDKKITEFRRFLSSINDILFEIINQSDFNSMDIKGKQLKLANFLKDVPYLNKDLKNLEILEANNK